MLSRKDWLHSEMINMELGMSLTSIQSHIIYPIKSEGSGHNFDYSK